MIINTKFDKGARVAAVMQNREGVIVIIGTVLGVKIEQLPGHDEPSISYIVSKDNDYGVPDQIWYHESYLFPIGCLRGMSTLETWLGAALAETVETIG